MRATVVGLAGVVASCALVTDLSGLGGADAGIDASAPDAPADGFVLQASPGHMTMDPGDAFPLAVTLVRGGAFTGVVNVTVNGQQPPYLVAGTATISGTSGALTVSLPQMPPQNDYVLDVVGQSADGTKTSTATLGVHVGSLVAVATSSTNVTLPSFATAILVKAWGAGGGGNGALNQNSGGSGGGGGFVSGVFSVTGGETLAIDIGAGGQATGGGGLAIGGGGGFSGVRRGSTWLAVAGGGGGGGAANDYYANGPGCVTNGSSGANGAAGGGTTGETRSGAAAPGTQTAGGAAGVGGTAGASLQAGCGGLSNGSCQHNSGGGAAGGYGNACGGGGGGGGGGWFGGGGGDGRSGTGIAGGGGGGSGYLAADGGTFAHGTGATPAATSDPDFGDAGAGGAGGYCKSNGQTCSNVGPVAGQPGRVVIRLAKP